MFLSGYLPDEEAKEQSLIGLLEDKSGRESEGR